MITRLLGVVVAVACSIGATAASATNLKPFDPVALQAVVEALGKELLLPGAMVLLHTPQGDFVFGYGATELGGTTPPRADTHFRIASNTKTMTAAVIVLLAQEGKLRFDDPVSKYVRGRSQRGRHHHQRAPENAERSLQLHLGAGTCGKRRSRPDQGLDPEELLAIAFKRPPVFAPGKEFDYCNTNYALLGLIAEKV